MAPQVASSSHVLAIAAVLMSGPTAWYVPGWIGSFLQNPLVGSWIKDKMLSAAMTAAVQPLEEEAARGLRYCIEWVFYYMVLPYIVLSVIGGFGIVAYEVWKRYRVPVTSESSSDSSSPPMSPAELHQLHLEIAQDVKRLNDYFEEQDRRLGVRYENTSPMSEKSMSPRSPGNLSPVSTPTISRDAQISELQDQLREAQKLHSSLTGYVRPIGDEAARAQHRARQLKAEIAELEKGRSPLTSTPDSAKHLNMSCGSKFVCELLENRLASPAPSDEVVRMQPTRIDDVSSGSQCLLDSPIESVNVGVVRTDTPDVRTSQVSQVSPVPYASLSQGSNPIVHMTNCQVCGKDGFGPH